MLPTIFSCGCVDYTNEQNFKTQLLRQGTYTFFKDTVKAKIKVKDAGVGYLVKLYLIFLNESDIP